MLTIYEVMGDRLRAVAGSDVADSVPPSGDLWIDLLSPSAEESERIAELTGIRIPKLAEMEEIEASARLYSERGAQFMTVTVVIEMDSEDPRKTPITFILKGRTLITVRYADPKPFRMFSARCQRADGETYDNAEAVLHGLVEAMVNRMADILERSTAEIDQISRDVFRGKARRANIQTEHLKTIIERIGRVGDMISMVREALVSQTRLLSYHQALDLPASGKSKTGKAKLRSLLRDVTSLSEYAASQSGKINFLLDATLGLINLEQNQIIKIFSVASVVFLPPTLVASIYGMNFDNMPELHWMFGYPWALVAMVASAAIPFIYFKRRGWL